MEQRAAESKSRREEYAIVNKRKRKAKVEKPDIKAADIDSDDELDEDFLSMVDSDRKSEAKAKKQDCTKYEVQCTKYLHKQHLCT